MDVLNLIEKFEKVEDSKPDSAYFYASKAANISRLIKNDSLYSWCITKKSFLHFKNGNKNEAINDLNFSLKYAIKTKNLFLEAYCYKNIGLIERSSNNKSQALIYDIKALKIAEKNNFYNLQCNLNIEIGACHFYYKDYKKAELYFKKSNQLAIKHNYIKGIIKSYANLAIISDATYIEYSLKGLKVAEKNNDFFNQNIILLNLAGVYIESSKKEDHEKALNCLKKVAKNKTTNSTDFFLLNANFGDYYAKKKQPKIAIQYYEKMLTVKNNLEVSVHIPMLYLKLFDTYREIKNYHKALEYRDLYAQINDSINSNEKINNFNEIQIKYEVEKKNSKIKLLLKQNEIEVERKRLFLFFSISLLILLTLGSVFFIQRIKAKKTQQKLDKTISFLEGQDEERNRIAKEIHDGIGGHLAFIKLSLSHLNSTLNDKSLENIIQDISKVFNELRLVSHNLSLNFIKDKDLAILLKDLIVRYNKDSNLQIQLFIFPDEELKVVSFIIKSNLYRIIQELIINIEKHSQATKATISITLKEERMNLIVEDNGIGFENKNKNGIGLKNIEERVQSMNGILTIDSKINSGSVFIIDIPLIQ